jgi:hypothetical protein
MALSNDMSNVFTITPKEELDLLLFESYGFPVKHNVPMTLQRCLKHTDIIDAYNITRSIPIGWEHRVNVTSESFYCGTQLTNYVMFKYMDNDIEKTCLCIVLDDKIVRIYDSNVYI